MKSPHQKMVALLVAQNNLEAPSQIPLKWLTRNLYGRPLLYWVCKAAEDCTQVDAIYIITQDKTVAHTATTLGLGKIRVLDTWSETPSQDWLVQQISEYAGCPYVAMLQPTAPLLSAPDLKRGYLKNTAGAIRSCRVGHTPTTAFVANYSRRRHFRRACPTRSF